MAHALDPAVDNVIANSRGGLATGRLSLMGGKLGDEVLARLAVRTDLPPVRELGLQGNALTIEGLVPLLSAPWLLAPRMVDLQGNPLGDAGLIALARWPRLDSVEHLVLTHTGTTAAGWAALGGSAHTRNLTRIHGGLDPVGDAGAMALVGVDTLQILTLRQAGIGPLGARALVTRRGLRSLDLDENAVGGALVGVSALGPDLESISLRKGGLTELDIRSLAASTAPGLRFVNLSYNPAGDAAVEALCAAPWLGALTSLEWMGSGAGDSALARLRAAWGSRRGLSIGR